MGYNKKAKVVKNIKNLEEYFFQSSLYLGILYPSGSNLAPKVDEDFAECENEAYWCSRQRHWVKDFKKTDTKKCDNGISVSSIFKVYYEEGYSYIPFQKRVEFRPRLSPFSLDDVISITSKVEFLSDTKLAVISEATVERKAKGEKLSSTKVLYDELYKMSANKDIVFSFTVTDYYEIIEKNLLLHYTDSSKFYETYEIPSSFKLEQGLNQIKKSPFVYDDITSDWICYEDISEVKKKLA